MGKLNAHHRGSGNDELTNEFRFDEPRGSDHNAKLIPKISKIYQPVRGRFEKGKSFYQMFAGPKTVLLADRQTTFANFTDGLSNTFIGGRSWKSR